MKQSKAWRAPRKCWFLSLLLGPISCCSHLKERPCEVEMNLFSECLTKGEACSELEEKYFKCVESAN